ncbi:MAG: hypothetical protein WAV38_12380 [Xanthobacteraceae bacterium]
MDAKDRANLYEEFLETAAKEYRCKPTDMPAKMAATGRLSFEVYQAQLIEGRNPDPATLRWFLEEEARYAPPPEPVRVELDIVHGIGICPSCGYTKPEPEPPPSPPTPPDDPPKDDTEPLPAAAAASNVVELPRRGGSIRDAVLPDGTPARMARSELWSYGAASDPVPDWGAAHSLPPIPPECFPK